MAIYSSVYASIHDQWVESGQVPEHVRIILVSLEIITGNQIFYPLLDCFEVRLYKQRVSSLNHVNFVIISKWAKNLRAV